MYVRMYLYNVGAASGPLFSFSQTCVAVRIYVWRQKQVSQAWISNCIPQYSAGWNHPSPRETLATSAKVVICVGASIVNKYRPVPFQKPSIFSKIRQTLHSSPMRGTGCLLWFQCLIYVLVLSLPRCLQYHTVKDHVITAPNCTPHVVRLLPFGNGLSHWRLPVICVTNVALTISHIICTCCPASLPCIVLPTESIFESHALLLEFRFSRLWNYWVVFPFPKPFHSWSHFILTALIPMALFKFTF